MRISDWSSDVCSSDLRRAPCTPAHRRAEPPEPRAAEAPHPRRTRARRTLPQRAPRLAAPRPAARTPPAADAPHGQVPLPAAGPRPPAPDAGDLATALVQLQDTKSALSETRVSER